MDTIYRLLRDLQQALEMQNPLSAMDLISKTIRNNLDYAWEEYKTVDDRIYEATKEIEELQYMLSLTVYTNEKLAAK